MFFAVVATSGTTNSASSTTSPPWPPSAVSSASGSTSMARTRGRLAAPSIRHRYQGIELADSFIVDPHKWLFAPFDCCALLYREPARCPGGAHPEGLLPRRPHRGTRVEPH